MRRVATPRQKRLAMMLANNQGVFVIPRAGLAAAFDAALGITSAGGFASAWADQSGNARNLLQATGANQPIHLPFAGTKYGWLPGVGGNYFSTPDSVAASITGDIDIRVKVALTDWTPSTNNDIVSKADSAGTLSYLLRIATTGAMTLFWSVDGSTLKSASSSVATGISDGSVKWVRATLDVDNGSSGQEVKFYLSDDGDTWSQLGTTQTVAGVVAIFNSNQPLQIGAAFSSGLGQPISGQCYRAQIYNGIDGTLAVDFDPSRWTSGTTFTAATGETWTINSTGSKPAQIVDRPSLLFDGAAHFMRTNPFTLNQPETVYFVGKQISWTSGDYIFDGNAVNTMVAAQNTASPDIAIYAGTLSSRNSEMAVGSRAVLSCTFNGDSSSITVNNGSTVTSAAGAGNAGGFTLGYAGTGTGLSIYSNIQAYEALIYNVAHDAATRANIIRALMSKHGVT